LVGFDDCSMIRRVHGESIVLLGGARALLLQVAHPAVAAAVAEHSTFRQGRVERLLRTLKPTLSIVFGDRAEVSAAAGSINAVHGRVHSPGYDATDPALVFWVLATLIDTALLMHALFLVPLEANEAQAYYEDMLDAGSLLGIDREQVPPDMPAFRSYMKEMLATLEVTSAARQIAADLFAGPTLFRALLCPIASLGNGLLPEAIRTGYGLHWGPGRQRVLNICAAAMRIVLPRLPRVLRAPPPFLLPKGSGQATLRRFHTRSSRRR
jgi:uncharacterized protein (DUF2236 family)